MENINITKAKYEAHSYDSSISFEHKWLILSFFYFVLFLYIGELHSVQSYLVKGVTHVCCMFDSPTV